MSPRDRMRPVSMAMSKELRHVSHASMQNDGYLHMDDRVDTPAPGDLRATRDDIRQIARGDGGNNKQRPELALMRDGVTDAIRAAQGHIRQSGVRGDVLPVAEHMETLIHGATLSDVKMIADEGIRRRDLSHVRLWGSDMGGKPARPSKKASRLIGCGDSGVIGKWERYGIISHRSSYGSIVTPGRNGVIPKTCILRVRRLPGWNAMWSSMTRRWGSHSAPAPSTRLGRE